MEDILASIRRIISDDVGSDVTAANEKSAVGNQSSPRMVTPVNRAVNTRVAEPVTTVSTKSPSVAPAAMSGAAEEGARSFVRPVVAVASRAAAGYTQAVVQRSLSEPRGSYEPSMARDYQPAHEVATMASVEKTSDEIDLEAPFAAALMDLALVEQAVQAEIAAAPVDFFASPDVPGLEKEGEAMRDLPSAQEPSERSAPVVSGALEADSVHLHDVNETEATSSNIDSALERNIISPNALETADMQVQAKPAPLSPRAAEPRAAEARIAPPSGHVVGGRSERLVSAPTNTAVAASFDSLARTVASNSRSVEDVVSDAIRPMLKSWLDENLPALVERLVRAEIERVARQG